MEGTIARGDAGAEEHRRRIQEMAAGGGWEPVADQGWPPVLAAVNSRIDQLAQEIARIRQAAQAAAASETACVAAGNACAQARQAREAEIENDQLRSRLRAGGESGFAAAHRQDVKPLLPQHVFDDVRDVGFIIDQQDAGAGGRHRGGGKCQVAGVLWPAGKRRRTGHASRFAAALGT